MISRNKRRLIHNITVYDFVYQWCSVDYKDDGTCVIKIWKYNDKIYEETVLSNDVNTRMIRAKIKNIMNLL